MLAEINLIWFINNLVYYCCTYYYHCLPKVCVVAIAGCMAQHAGRVHQADPLLWVNDQQVLSRLRDHIRVYSRQPARLFLRHCTAALTAAISLELFFSYWHCQQVAVAEWLARLTAVWEDPGSNHAADGCVHRDSRCDIQPWAWAVHPYCSAYVDSAFHPLWDGKMSISLQAE